MAKKLILSLLLTLVFQTLILNALAMPITPKPITTPKPIPKPTPIIVDPQISNFIKHMARVRMIKLIKDFNQTKKGFQRLQNSQIDDVSRGVASIWVNDTSAQAVEAFKIIIENNHFLYPKLRTYKSFDWLLKFIRQVNVGKSILKNESALYKCLMATYPSCMAEAGKDRTVKLLQKFECSYRFFTDCKYDEYRVANPALRLLDFNAFSE